MLFLHAEVVATVKLEHIHLFEAALVEEQVYALACREFPLGMLFFNGLFAAAQACFGAQLNELFDFFQLFAHCL